VGALRSKRDHQSVPIPPKAASLSGGLQFIRPQLVFVLDRSAPRHKRRLVMKRRLAMRDAPDTAAHAVSARAESAGLSVQDPFARKIRPVDEHHAPAILDEKNAT